jgi:hypothetical protein
MKLVYHGPHDAVEIDMPDGSTLEALRNGDPIEVPDDMGANMLLQPANWRKHEPPVKPTSKEKE